MDNSLKGVIAAFAGVIVGAGIVGCSNTAPDDIAGILPVNEYELEVWGKNPSVLEFVPEGNPDYVCILPMSAASDIPRAVACIPRIAKKLEDA